MDRSRKVTGEGEEEEEEEEEEDDEKKYWLKSESWISY